MLLKELIAKITLDALGFKKGADETKQASEEVERTLKAMKDGCETSGKAMGLVWQGVGKAAGFAAGAIKVAGLSITGTLTASAYAAQKFETAMFNAWKNAQDGAEASGKGWEQFQQAARDTAAAIGTHADKIGDMYNSIADRGYNATEAVKIGAEAAKLGKAAHIDYATAGDAVARSMLLYEKHGLTAAKAANTLAVAAISGALKIEDMGMAFNTVLPTAERIGVKFEDIIGVLGKLSERMGGQRAMMALNMLMDDLADSTSATSKALAEQGIRTIDSTGKMRPLMTILDELKYKQIDLNKVSNNPMFKNLVDALKTMDLRDIRQQISTSTPTSGTSYLDKQVAEVNKTFGGALETFTGSWGQLFSTIGMAFKKFLVPVLGDLSDRILKVGQLLRDTGALDTFFKGLAEAYDQKLKPMLDKLWEKIKAWAETLTPEKVQGWVDAFVAGCEKIYKFLSALLELSNKLMNNVIAAAGEKGKTTKMSGLQKEGIAIGGGAMGLAGGGLMAAAAGLSGPVGWGVAGLTALGTYGLTKLGLNIPDWLGGMFGKKGQPTAPNVPALATPALPTAVTSTGSTSRLAQATQKLAGTIDGMNEQEYMTYVETIEKLTNTMATESSDVREQLNTVVDQFKTAVEKGRAEQNTLGIF